MVQLVELCACLYDVDVLMTKHLQSFWDLQKLHRIFHPFGDVGLRIGPIGGLSTDGNISPQEERKKERCGQPTQQLQSTFLHG